MNNFIFLFLLLNSVVSAQEVLIPDEKDGKWGYISFDTKEVVVPYQYTLAEEFTHYGIAKVKLGEKWGILDSDGKELVPVKYDDIYLNENKYKKAGVTRFKLDGKWGLFDNDFKTILPAKYEMIQQFFGDYITYDEDTRRRSERKNLSWFKAKKAGKWGVIDADDKVVLSFKYDNIAYIGELSTIFIHPASPQKPKLYLPGSSDNSYKIKNYHPVSINYFLVKNEKQGKIIDKDEKVIYSVDDFYTDWEDTPNPAILYTSRETSLENDLFVLDKNKKLGIVSTKGKLVLPFEYEEIIYYPGNIFHVKKEGKYGIVNPSGDILQPPLYDHIYGHEVILNDKHGILKPDYKSLLYPLKFDHLERHMGYKKPTGYKELLAGYEGLTTGFRGSNLANRLYPTSGLIHIQKNNKEGLLDEEGDKVLPLKKQTIQFNKQSVIIKNGKRWRMMDYKQNTLLEPKYDSITVDRNMNSMFMVKKKNQYGLWNIDKKDWEIPLEYDAIKIRSKNQTILQKNRKWGVYRFKKGEEITLKYDEIRNSVGRIGDRWEALDGYILNPEQIERAVKKNQRGIQKHNGKYGVIGIDDQWLLPPEYQEISYAGPYYEITKDGKKGIMIRKGTLIITPQYEEIFYNTSYNFIKAKQNGKWGVINKENKILVPFEYDKIDGLRKNILRIFDGTYWRMVNLKEKEIYKTAYTNILNMKAHSKYEPALIVVTKAYRSGLIDEKNNIILPCYFQNVKNRIVNFELTRIPELFPVKDKDKWGYAQKDGKIVIPFQFKTGSYFYKNAAIVKKENRYYLIDPKGNLLTKTGYQSLAKFNLYTDLVIVTDEQGKQGVINIKGEETVPLIYDYLKEVSKYGQRLFHARLNGRYGIINNNGIVIAPIIHRNQVGNMRLGLIVGKTASLRGLNGKILLKKQYDDVRSYHKNYYIVQENDKVGIIDILTEKIILPIEYDKILSSKYSPCSMEYFVVQKGEKVGLVDQSNKPVLPFEYESIHPYPHLNLLILSKDGKAALTDMQGNAITKFEYEGISSTKFPPFPAKKNGKWRYIDTAGKIIYPFEFEHLYGFNTYKNNKYIQSKNSLCSPLSILDSLQLQAITTIAGKKFWLSVDGELTERSPVITDETKPDTTKITYNIFAIYDPINRCRYLVNQNGEKILPHAFSKIYEFGGGFIQFKIKGGKAGFYLPSVKKEVQYISVQEYTPNIGTIRWVRNDYKYGFINKEGIEITPLHFDAIGFNREGSISVLKDGKIGFLDESGQIKIPLKFDDDGRSQPWFVNGVAYAYLNGKYGFINPAGKTLAPFEFDAIAYFKDGEAIAYRNGKWEQLKF